MAISLSGIDGTVRLVVLAVLATAAVVAVVMAAGGLWVIRLGLGPIAEVTQVADAIVAGDRSRRVAASTLRTEAGRLGRAFNLMLDEQQALEARLRQFIADVSHELRSPVTAIKGLTDRPVATRQPAPGSRAGRHHAPHRPGKRQDGAAGRGLVDVGPSR